MKTSFSVRAPEARETTSATGKRDLSIPFHNRPFLILLIAITVMQATFALLLASRKPLWFDEINTLAVSQLHSWSAIWQADLNHADGMPPLYHYLEGLFLRLPVRPEIALRIPSVLGFSLLIPSLFMFANRSLGQRCASVAACLPLVSSAYSYSYEARGYALTLGFTTAALLFWQKAQDNPQGFAWPIALGLVLAAASATNYNAVYGFVPFFIAEGVSALRHRRINWRVLPALAFAFVPCGLYWPVLSGFRHYYGAGFFAKPSFRHLAGASVFSWADQSTAAFLFLLVIVGVVVIFWFPKTRFQKAGDRPGVRPEECAICLSFCALPAFVFLINSVLKGGMVPRYSICMVIGASLLAAYAIRSFKPAAASTMVVACAIAAFAAFGARHLRDGIDPAQSVWKQHPLLQQALDGKATIAIASGLAYVPLAYYSSPEARDELFYLADPVQALHYLHTDTVDLNVRSLARYLPLQIQSLQSFAATHHDFLVYTNGDQWNWLSSYLVEHGAVVRRFGQNEQSALYQVSLPESNASLKSGLTTGRTGSLPAK